MSTIGTPWFGGGGGCCCGGCRLAAAAKPSKDATRASEAVARASDLCKVPMACCRAVSNCWKRSSMRGTAPVAKFKFKKTSSRSPVGRGCHPCSDTMRQHTLPWGLKGSAVRNAAVYRNAHNGFEAKWIRVVSRAVCGQRVCSGPCLG